ncbi:hypothetical protein HDU76_003653 [Blyttiomyces sp. JEL0837]|nr:hypothetical protein HDU76_003653 [Blyttiomyces sp. JEL0837]
MISSTTPHIPSSSTLVEVETENSEQSTASSSVAEESLDSITKLDKDIVKEDDDDIDVINVITTTTLVMGGRGSEANQKTTPNITIDPFSNDGSVHKNPACIRSDPSTISQSSISLPDGVDSNDVSISRGGRLEMVTGNLVVGFALEFGDGVNDSLDGFSGRTNWRPALLSFDLAIDMEPLSTDLITTVATQASKVNGMLQIIVKPSINVEDVPDSRLRELALLVKSFNENLKVPVYVVYCPELNANWNPTYGMRPFQTLKSFRTLADYVHLVTNMTAMVWTPALGVNYPFLGNGFALPNTVSDPTNLVMLDTNRNGKLDKNDDPYGPYYPGDQYVDWVGLTMYNIHMDPTSRQYLPTDKTYLYDSLIGDTTPNTNTNFYHQFSASRNKPLSITLSGAPYKLNGTNDIQPPAEIAVKQSWWRHLGMFSSLNSMGASSGDNNTAGVTVNISTTPTGAQIVTSAGTDSDDADAVTTTPTPTDDSSLRDEKSVKKQKPTLISVNDTMPRLPHQKRDGHSGQMRMVRVEVKPFVKGDIAMEKFRQVGESVHGHRYDADGLALVGSNSYKNIRENGNANNVVTTSRKSTSKSVPKFFKLPDSTTAFPNLKMIVLDDRKKVVEGILIDYSVSKNSNFGQALSGDFNAMGVMQAGGFTVGCNGDFSVTS